MFSLSFLMMLGGILFYQIKLENERKITTSTDDHLAYLVKSSNLKNCLTNEECLGLNQSTTKPSLHLIM